MHDMSVRSEKKSVVGEAQPRASHICGLLEARALLLNPRSEDSHLEKPQTSYNDVCATRPRSAPSTVASVGGRSDLRFPSRGGGMAIHKWGELKNASSAPGSSSP